MRRKLAITLTFGAVAALAVVPPAGAGRRTALIAAGWPLTVVDERGAVRWQGPDATSPAWSPGQDRLAFLVAGTQRVAVADVGSERVAVVEGHEGPARSPAWSPDGEWVAFVGERGETVTGHWHWEVFVARPSGCCARAVTAFPPEWTGAGFVRWTPDGRLVAAVNRTPDEDPDAYELFAVDPRSGAMSQLTDRLGGGPLAWFDVSPVDGTIAVWAAGALWRLDGGGTPPQRLVSTGVTAPAWAPDGRWIAYLDAGLHVVRPDGSAHRVVTSAGEAGAGVSGPSWFPDGRRLAYVHRPDGIGQSDAPVVVTVGLDDGDLRVVARRDTWFGGVAVAPAFFRAR